MKLLRNNKAFGLLSSFVSYLRAEKRYSAFTARNYRHDVAEFIDHLAADEFHPNLVTTDDVRSWIVSLSEDGKLSPSTINGKVTAVRSFFRWLRATGVVEKNIFLKIPRLKTSKRLPVWIPEAKMSEIVDYLLSKGDKNSVILLLLYSCGIRLAELVGIKEGDIGEGCSFVKVHGKGGKDRIVPLPEVTARALREYIDNNGWEPPSRTEVYRAVRRELELMGVQGKRSPHVLRHTFATHLLDHGADIREIQELLGHTSLAATQVYTHNSIAALKKAYKGAHPREKN